MPHRSSPAVPGALLALVAVLAAAPVPAVPASDGETGEPIVVGHRLALHSGILDEDCTLSIRLPGDYEETQGGYPLLVILNAEWTLLFAHAAAACEIVSGSARMPEMIVVGIHSNDSARDFFPVAVGPRQVGGGADRFLRYIVEEAIPLVESRYRTEPFRILCGQSNAGLFTVYAAFARPDAFQAYLASSPMLGWCPEFVLGLVRERLGTPPRAPRFLHLLYGEDDYERVTEHVPDLAALLDEQAPAALAWHLEVLPAEGHVPFTGLYRGLVRLFPDWSYGGREEAPPTLAGAIEHYAGLSRRYGFNVPVPAETLADLAVDHLQAERLDEALEIMAYCAELHPAQARSHYLLGIVHQRRGETEEARARYRRALELEPGHQGATRRLAELDASG